jgi:hypothetical protein
MGKYERDFGDLGEEEVAKKFKGEVNSYSYSSKGDVKVEE